MEDCMEIIIIGCGKVGSALAEQLSQEDHNITIIDISSERLQEIGDDIDAMQIVGNGSSIQTLTDAGVSEADILIAVTNSDEMNLLCCVIARNLSQCHTVARVRNPLYNKEVELIKNSLGISMIINPELAAAAEISRLLLFPSAIKIDPFAKGRVTLLKFRIRPEFHLNNTTIAEFTKNGKYDILVAGVERGDQIFIPNGDFQIQDGDLVSILSTPLEASAFFKSFGLKTDQVKNCMIVGGGTIAVYLARMLIKMKIRVVIIDRSRERCEQLTEILPEATIIHGDGTKRELLMEENLNNAESFVSLTNFDEENILMSLFVSKNTNRKVITKINRINFHEIVEDMDLGSIIHPKYITSDLILQYTRAAQNSIGSNVETLYHILDHKAEALEFSIRNSSPAIGIPLKDLTLKSNLLIGCINRNGIVMIPRGSDSLQIGDTVVVVTTQRQLQDITDILA